MSIFSDKNEHDVHIVEALLAGKEALSAGSDSVEQWERVLSVVQSDAQGSDQELIDSVMARIEAGTTEEVSVASHRSRGWMVGGIAVAAMALLMAMPFISSSSTPSSNDAPYRVTVGAENRVGAMPMTLGEDAQLLQATVSTNTRDGVVVLGNVDDKSIVITSALRLEAVNGNLRIDSL